MLLDPPHSDLDIGDVDLGDLDHGDLDHVDVDLIDLDHGDWPLGFCLWAVFSSRTNPRHSRY